MYFQTSEQTILGLQLKETFKSTKQTKLGNMKTDVKDELQINRKKQV